MMITSTENNSYKHIKQLLNNSRYRKKHQQTVMEGIHLIDSYLQKSLIPCQIWLSEDYQNHHEVMAILEKLAHHHHSNTSIYTLPESLYKKLRSLGDGVNIMAIIDIPNVKLTKINTDALILNDVQDIGNVGTLLRTAAAVGVNHVVSTSGTANVWTPKCLRAGMGAQFSLNIYQNISIEQIMNNVTTAMLATSSHTDALIYQSDLKQPIAWVMGNEGQGVSNELMSQSQLIALPQPNGQESLNVAIAGSLCMYEMIRQRHHG